MNSKVNQYGTDKFQFNKMLWAFLTLSENVPWVAQDLEGLVLYYWTIWVVPLPLNWGLPGGIAQIIGDIKTKSSEVGESLGRFCSGRGRHLSWKQSCSQEIIRRVLQF